MAITLLDERGNKEVYTTLHDTILDKRFHSPSPIRRHAHHTQYQTFVDLIPKGSSVLDSGCGEGVLCVLLAKKGCKVMGIDLSEPNIIAAKKYAEEQGVPDILFQTGDAESLPVPNQSYDYVVSSHVLEHVPDFTKGASELARVAKKQVIVAIPTCLNPSAMVLLGGDKYWMISRKTPYAFFWGMLQVVGAFLQNTEGVNEGYAGRKDLIHIWRFPWKGKKSLEKGNLRVLRYCGSSYILPYLPAFIPLSRVLLLMRWLPFFRNFGYGTTYVCESAVSNNYPGVAT